MMLSKVGSMQLTVYNVLLSVGYNRLWMPKLIFSSLPMHHTSHIPHTTCTLQMPTFLYVFFFVLLSSFCISESRPHNIESLKINQMSKEETKRKMHETNFIANTFNILLLWWVVVCPRCAIGFSAIKLCFLSVSCLYINYLLYTLLDSAWSTVNCVSFVNALSELFVRLFDALRTLRIQFLFYSVVLICWSFAKCIHSFLVCYFKIQNL